MNNFEELFGLKPENIKPHCVLVPYQFPGMQEMFRIRQWEKGLCFSCGNSQNLSLILTRIGAPFVGDAVLRLNETPCQNLFFLGSCGLVSEENGLSIGNILLADKAYAIESFSDMLKGNFPSNNFIQADNNFLKNREKIPTAVVNIASVGSICLETKLMDFYEQHQIKGVDLESAAFLHAAKHIHRRAAAILYPTDILNKTSPFSLSAANKRSMEKSRLKAAEIIQKFCE